MGRSSTRHAREFYGVDSAGNTPEEFGERFSNPSAPPSGDTPPTFVITTASGDTVTPAVLTFGGEWRLQGSADAIGLATAVDGSSGFSALIYEYVPGGPTPEAAATAFAAALGTAVGFTGNFTATAVGATVEILATGTQTTVTLSDATIKTDFETPVLSVSPNVGDQVTPAVISFGAGTYKNDGSLDLTVTLTPSGDVSTSGDVGTYGFGGAGAAFLEANAYIDGWLLNNDPSGEGNLTYTRVINTLEVVADAPDTAVSIDAATYDGSAFYP